MSLYLILLGLFLKLFQTLFNSLMLGIFLSMQSLAVWADLPDFGSPDATIMSPAQEKRFGKAFMRSIWASQKVIEDPLVRHYIQSLGHSLANKSDEKNRHFSFFLINDPSINAFAGPDGYIGVFAGLMLTAESEDELAAVIAHEIAHVTQKHLLRAFSAADKMTIPMAAILLGAILLGAAGGADAGIALAMGGQAALQQSQINFTRANEKEADNIGMQLLKRSQFDPHAMAIFFGKMLKANQNYISELPEFLRSHPITTNRISDARARAETYPYRQHIDSIGFKLVRVRLRLAQYIKPMGALRAYQQRLKKGHSKNSQAIRYGYSLALINVHQYQQAQVEINKLLAIDPLNLFYNSALAETLMAQKKYNQVNELLENLLALFPDNEALTILSAENLVKQRSYQKAYNKISRLHYKNPDNPTLLQMLSEISAKLKHYSQARLYLAELYFTIGLTDVAIKQLEDGLRLEKMNDYQRAMLSAKLNEYKIIQALLISKR